MPVYDSTIKTLPKTTEATTVTDALTHPFVRSTDQSRHIVLVNDNVPLTLTWEMAAEEAKINLSVYHAAPALMDNLAQHNKNSVFYIDINLGNHSGIDLSKTLFKKGYKNLYLITGRKVKDYPDVDWVQDVLGIESPF